MNNNQVRIGYLASNHESVFLSKHKWDCDWYWGFGYLSTQDAHFHFSNMLPNISDEKRISIMVANDIDTIVLDEKLNGFTLMELFYQAYALKDYAEICYLGHAGIGDPKKLGIPQDKELAKTINQQLKTVLDNIWNYVNQEESKE